MSSPSQVAAGFTITGLLDGASRTRGRYPVSEIAVADIADHPANAAYSMDPAGIAELAESIREDGLTDLPLVRKVGDGSWQMVSGHRRKAAYALLAKDDPAYERMPCRVIEGIDDERAVTLLHAANYFTRALTVTERAAATEALRGDAVRLRSEDPSLSGMRVDDVKAAIIERQTGRKVSGKTIAREERLARRIAEDLSPEWAAEADRGNLSAEAVRSLAGMPKERQAEMHAAMEPWRRTKRELSDYVRSEGKTQAGPDGRIAKAARLVADFLESPPESPSPADPHQLENAILNLALNARDAMPAGGTLTITLRARNLAPALARLGEVAAGDYAQIDVSDTGQGIEAAVLARVFEPFFTTKPFGDGSGLGLSMVYGFVRQSGGNIRLLSTPGKGTSVRFVLPAAQPASAVPMIAEQTPGHCPQIKGPVLLVEDEPEVRKVIRMQLTTLGCAVLEAADGVEALALLENIDDIAVLLTDTVMPGGLNGHELAQRARLLRPSLPILLLTGYTRAAVEADATLAAIPVLRKPFDPPALVAALRALLPQDANTEASTP